MKITILVVEDSAAMRALVCQIVENIGYHTLEAESGEQAVEMFQGNDVDLVLLDVDLPGMNGFETCRQIRALREDDLFPVIYLSASSADEYIVKGLEAGGDAYVSKPVNASVLESIVKAMGRISDMKKALAQANQKLSMLASRDGLTQIPNRRSFDESLSRYWKQSRRNKTDLALLLIDVDHFKPFNDNYGHLEGDKCLVQVAQTIEQKLLRPFDLAARYGGEEFAVLLPEINREGTLFVVNRLVNAIQDLAIPHQHSTTAKVLTVSVGVAFAQKAKDQQDLITLADKALYQAKENGRNQFCESS